MCNPALPFPAHFRRRYTNTPAILPHTTTRKITQMQEQEAACFFWLLFGSKKKKKTHKHKHNGDGN